MALRDRWLTSVVRCSSRIYTHKKALLSARGLDFVAKIFFLLLDEVILSILALPLLFVSSSGSDSLLELPTFKVRRAITISALVVLTCVWMVKSFVVVGREFLISNETYFSVRVAGSVPVLRGDANAVVPSTPASLPPPDISFIRSTYRTLLALGGTGSPGKDIRLFIEEQGSMRSVVFTTPVAMNGTWTAVFDALARGGYTVPAGTYHITAIVEDGNGGSTSIPSKTMVWIARPSPGDIARTYAGKALDFLVLIAVSIGVLITFLTVS